MVQMSKHPYRRQGSSAPLGGHFSLWSFISMLVLIVIASIDLWYLWKIFFDMYPFPPTVAVAEVIASKWATASALKLKFFPRHWIFFYDWNGYIAFKHLEYIPYYTLQYCWKFRVLFYFITNILVSEFLITYLMLFLSINL